MLPNDAKTFVQLAQHIEQTLKSSQVFYSAASAEHPEGAAALLSLELKEVRFLKHGTSGVYMVFDAVFNSAHGTVMARTDHTLHVQLGVYDLTLGSSSAREENGNTSRTITCQVARPLLSGAMSDEVEKLCGNKASQATDAAVKAVRKSADYKSEAAVLQAVESEIKKLQQRQERHKARLLAMETSALQKVLPVTGKAKGKLPFTVVIA